MKTLDELQSLINGYKNGSVRFDFLLDALRELIADAERYRWLRNGNAYSPEEHGVSGGQELDELCDECRKG